MYLAIAMILVFQCSKRPCMLYIMYLAVIPVIYVNAVPKWSYTRILSYTQNLHQSDFSGYTVFSEVHDEEISYGSLLLLVHSCQYFAWWHLTRSNIWWQVQTRKLGMSRRRSDHVSQRLCSTKYCFSDNYIVKVSICT